MKGNIEERACRLALYIIENRATVRAAARQFYRTHANLLLFILTLFLAHMASELL